MDKNEILEKSRKENNVRDEREKQISSYAQNANLLILMIVGIIIIIFDTIHDIDISGIMSMFWAGCLGEYIYKYIKTKEKSSIIIMIICVIFLIKNLVEHFSMII